MANCACHLHYISAAYEAYNHLEGPFQAFISCTPKASEIIGLHDLEIGHWAVKYQPLGKALNSDCTLIQLDSGFKAALEL